MMGVNAANAGQEENRWMFHRFDMLLVVRLVLAAAMLVLSFVLELSRLMEITLVVVSAVISGFDVVLAAIGNIFKKRYLNEQLIMTLTVVATFLIGRIHEGALVMFLFRMGVMFHAYALTRTKETVENLMDLRSGDVTILTDGKEARVHASSVMVGDTIIIRAGEKVAADCIVVGGKALLDIGGLAGETPPIQVDEDDRLPSGATLLRGGVIAEVTAEASSSTAARILDILRLDSPKTGALERKLIVFSRFYTPAMLVVAVIIAVLFPLLFELSIIESISRALVFFAISCLGALVATVPLAYIAGTGGASRQGIIFKSSGAMDAAARTKAVVFDKAGTLTEGNLRVVSVKSNKLDSDIFLKTAAHAESYSDHPIARSIIKAYGGPIYIELIENFMEFPGKGISASVEGVEITVGSEELFSSLGVAVEKYTGDETVVYMAFDGKYAGRIVLSDTIKEGVNDAVQSLYGEGCSQVVMLSGESADITDSQAKAAGIAEYYTNCALKDKLGRLREIKTRLNEKDTLLYVESGDCSESAHEAADVSAAMGGFGEGLASEYADILIMNGNPNRVAACINVSKNTRFIIVQSLLLALLVKIIVIALGVTGIAGVWFAVFAEVSVSLAAVLNSMRAYFTQN